MNDDLLQKILFELVDIKRELRKRNPHAVADPVKKEPPKDADIMLLGFIQRHGKVSKTQVTYRMQAIGDSETISRVLDKLISQGKVKREKQGRTSFFIA